MCIDRNGSYLYESVGTDGFEPPKVKTSRFTVCPIWPLWNMPDTYWFKISMLQMYLFTSLSCCDSHRIQTYNLLIRSQMLYSVELASHIFRGLKLIAFRLSFLPLSCSEIDCLAAILSSTFVGVDGFEPPTLCL